MPERKDNLITESRSNCLKGKTDLSEYFGALKDNPVPVQIEADAKLVRAMAGPRYANHEYRSAN
jgi:hypothetical protein